MFLISQSVLFCKLCKIKINAGKRLTVLQHLHYENHIKSVKQVDMPKKKVNSFLNLIRRLKNVSLIKTFMKLCYLLIFLLVALCNSFG